MTSRSSLKTVAHIAVGASLGWAVTAHAADVAITTAASGDGLSVSTPALPAPAMRIDHGGLVVRGTHGEGTIPAEGPGTRMMFDTKTGSFRVGRAIGLEWDEANLNEFTFAGGNQVTASGYGSFAYGDQAVASGTVGVALGSGVITSGTAGFSAGANNVCSGFSCVAIGYTNTALGQGSVALGYRTTANADYSVALGYRASSGGHRGSFIVGDESTTATVSNTADNQFMARASGGFRFRTNADLSTGCDLPAGSGVFTCTSDRNQKEDFQVLDAQEVLEKVVSLPVTNWRYIAEKGNVRHLGPVAQDFYAAFGLGSDDTTIGVNDMAGVSLVAVQALAARTDELQAKSQEVDLLRAEVSALRQALALIEQRLQNR